MEFEKIYVIGDIHGRLDLLDQLIIRIERDHGPSDKSASLTITLGDYVDRGPSSREVIERLCSCPFPTKYVALKGNHELLLERFLKNPSTWLYWRHLGGIPTLESYGIPKHMLFDDAKIVEMAGIFRKALPPRHLAFIKSLRTSISIGNYYFCHAGVRPGKTLENQIDDDLLWIRDEFLNSDENFGKTIIHGHTPIAQPEVLVNRVNIDTGAFFSGRLTCLVLDASAEGVRFFSAIAS